MAASYPCDAVRGGAHAQAPGADEQLGVCLAARAEELRVAVFERALVGGAQQVCGIDQRALVVEDRRLDGAVQELIGVTAEELVERVLAGDVDRQTPAAAAGAAPHLAQRGDGPGERDDHGRVELADVDPQLQRVGRDHRAQLTTRQPALQLAPLLGGVAGAVGRDQLGQLGVPGRRQLVLDEAAQQLDALARLHEADRARAVAHESREQLGRLAQGGAACAQRRVGQRRVPHRDPPSRRGGAVVVDQRDVLQSREALGQFERVGDRRGGQQDARPRAVGGGDPPQPAQHVGDVRAEHAAIDVRLVDHHHREVGEQLGPGGVVGEDADVQHVGVGEHHVRLAADVRARLAWGVAVVDRGPHALGQPERVQRARLVLGQRLGRVQVQRTRARVAAEHVQRRQVEAQRLARGRPGRDDRRSRPGGVQGLGLVAVQPLDPDPSERREHVRVQLRGEVHQLRFAWPLTRFAHQPLVRAALVQERAPGLDCAV